ncbi:MAG: phosphoglycerate dehydrogenase [Methanobrevibacter sp.]
MKVLVADAIDQKGIDRLKEVADVVVDTTISPEDLLKTIKEYDGIAIRSRTKMTAEVIEAAENLKIIARAGVGVDNVDLDAATKKGIMVVNAPESTSITVAEHTMGLMLAVARKIAIADKSTKEGKWEKKLFKGMELKGKTLGVIGMGRIGSQVVKRCQAFEMDALAYDPYLPPEVAQDMGVELTDLDTVLKNADVITIHVPLTPETNHLISTEQFEIMKENAIIMNCARGGIIDEDALYDALKNDKIGGAALDVYETEPPKDNKLMELDNIVCTPHIAASTKEAQKGAAIIIADEIADLFAGKTPNNVINMPRVDNSGLKDSAKYLELCEKLGSFISQSINGHIKEVSVIYGGEISELSNKEIFTRTVLQGILNPILSSPVTVVNAPAVAESRGISVTEGSKKDAKGYDSFIKVTGKTDSDEFSAEGTVLFEPKILKVDGYWVDVKPEGNMFIARYKDVPGTIGSIGTILGEANINVGVMQIGRDTIGGNAVMILTVDHEIPEDVLEKLVALDNVHNAVKIKL